MVATDIIYEGSAVGEDGNGYSQPLTAGDPFQGFAVDGDYDNSAGGVGDVYVHVVSQGIACNLTVAGATAVTANDMPAVYASDDNTFTLTASSNTNIGNVVRWISSTVCDVYFDVPRKPSSIVAGDIASSAVTTVKINADAVDGTKIADDAISLEHLDAAITPTMIPLYSGQITTTGGTAAEAETISGIAATDYAIITVVSGTAVYGSAACTTNTLTVTFDVNPSSDTIYNYLIFRAAA